MCTPLGDGSYSGVPSPSLEDRDGERATSMTTTPAPWPSMNRQEGPMNQLAYGSMS